MISVIENDASSHETGIDLKTQTILLVDDNPANLKLLAGPLEDKGFRVVVALGGEEANRRAHLVKPDLILLDVMMSGIDGFETCRIIKSEEEFRDTPVIFMSALSDSTDKLTGFSVGAVDYITKPIQIAEMMARVTTHLELSNLRKKLETQNKELHEIRDELELRVNKRTKELVDANKLLLHEIDERKRAEEQVRYIASHDWLTDLPNRMLFKDRLSQLIAQAQRRKEMVAVLFLDLDQFKNVNDSLGHHIGDMLLCEVARRLVSCLRSEDTVARLGGDEFVICLPGQESREAVYSIARKIFESLRENFSVKEFSLNILTSIGISLYPDDGTDVDTLMSNSDTAMYHAKQSGRAEIKFYTAELNEQVQRHLSLSGLLKEAFDKQELFMEFQPQVDLNSGKIIGAEALMRWRRSDGTMISPAEFIPAAEANGLIKELGEWGLHKSCAELKRWHDAGHDSLRMAVNISVSQFHATGFLDTIKTVIKDYKLPASAIELEITESLLMQHSEANMGILNKLSKLGLCLAVDDFGTGYSSLAYLQDFPVNVLKIDISFVRNIGTEHGNAIPKAIIAMAHGMNLKVVAEGVELDAQEAFLKSRGCDFAQGYFYGKPMLGNDFLQNFK